MPPYTVALVGCGGRGAMHAQAILAFPERFHLVAVCDMQRDRLLPFAAQFGIARTYTDACTMLATERPDIFCFATLPAMRLPLVQLGVQHGVKAIACEKPMALSLAEAQTMLALCNAAGVRLIVCHQLKYGAHWQQARDIVRSGAIGDVHMLHATARPSLLRVGTHLIDAMLWLNGEQPGVWVMGQVHGKTAYSEDHPCPDHLMGVIRFRNGVQGLIECGTLAPHLMAEEDFWLDGAVTVHGTQGYVRAGIGCGWQALTTTSPDTLLGGPSDLTPQEPQFHADLARWLDDPHHGHPCNGDVSYHGFELLMGMMRSSLERRQVTMPLAPAPSTPELTQLERVLL